MATKRIIGIDFGTSTSVVRVKRYEGDRTPIGDRLFVNNVLFDGRDSVPTLVQLPDDIEITPELTLSDDDCDFGYYAAAEQPGMITYRNFKVELENDQPDVRTRAKWLTRRFFQYLYEVYQQQKNQLGDNSDEEITYVSYPAKYAEENRQFMIDAAAQAGFKNVKGITEPEAAVRAVMVQEEKELRALGLLGGAGCSYLLFLDMGAGTTDIAVCRYENDETQIISTWPDKTTNIYFGGKDVDYILTGYIERYLRDHRDIVPEYFIDSFSDKYIDNIKTWKETTVSRTLKRGKSIPYFQTVKNPYPSLPDFSPSIGRGEFERACTEYLKNFAVLINGSLNHTQSIAPEFPGSQAIDLVILTGGHSQWYFIKDMLEGKRPEFGSLDLTKIRSNPARICVNGKPQETVAMGMAYEPLRVIRQSGPEVKSTPDGNRAAARNDRPPENPKESMDEINAEMTGYELNKLARMSYSDNKAAGRVIPANGLSYTVNDMLSWLPAEVEQRINRWNSNPGFLWKYYENHYKALSGWSQKLRLQLLTDEVPILYLNRKGAERGNLIEYGLIFTNKRIHWRFDFLYRDSIFYNDIVDIKPIILPNTLVSSNQAASDKESGLAVRHFYMEQNARKIKTTNIWMTYTEDQIIPEYQLFEAFFKGFRGQ